MGSHNADACGSQVVLGDLEQAARESSDRRRSLALGAGAVGSAFVASACCVGPLVLTLLGIGGGALLVGLEPYRPLLTGLTAVFLGGAFWLRYRKLRAAARAGGGSACACPAPRASKVAHIALWATTALVLAVLAFPYIAPLIWG
ncbi:MAG: mercury transporter MerT [Candidatus Schekmanbacteria bacterium]|nr:mercury transporter MerT [Candidatus Schekmanbacteria bacterium]